jgi:S-phase kinase-associated protein 1
VNNKSDNNLEVKESDSKNIPINNDNKIESLDDLEKSQVTLITKDNVRVSVDRKIIQQSVLIKTMMEDNTEETELDIPNIENVYLQKILKYLNHHFENPAKEIEKPVRSNNIEEIVSKFDAEFIDCEQEILFELILAANYLDVKPILDLACAKVASMIKGKTAEEIRKIFNLVNDFTPEEEAQVIAENKWADEC